MIVSLKFNKSFTIFLSGKVHNTFYYNFLIKKKISNRFTYQIKSKYFLSTWTFFLKLLIFNECMDNSKKLILTIFLWRK